MKIYILISIAVFCGLSYSCQKCELIEQDITYPPVDTIPPCSGVFYVNSAAMDQFSFTFFNNEFNKPIPDPFIYAEGTGPHLIPTEIFTIESNFSAYDSINNEYVFEYLYDHGGPPIIQFFHQNLNTGVFTITEQSNTYGAPVYWEDRLFAIKTISDADFVQYEVVELDPLTGAQMNINSTGNFFSNSPFTIRTMSSAGDGSGYVFFLSGTNMVAAKLPSNSSQHYNVDPTYDPMTNPVAYFGLEIRLVDGLFLAMKAGRDINGNPETTLVYLHALDSPPLIEEAFDISANLPSGQDDRINPEFYSTTFDQCDYTYYVTELQDGGATNLTEIGLSTGMLKSQTIANYWHGIELGVGQ